MNCKLGFIIICVIIFIIFIIEIKNVTKSSIIQVFNPLSKINYNMLGDNYFYGTYKIRPDYIKAIENYNKVFIYDPDNENIPQIRQNLNTLIDNNNKFDINRIILDEIEFGVHNDPNDYIINIELNKLPLLEPLEPLEPLELLQNDIFNFNNNIENNYKEIVYNDFQNVHDSVVNKTVESSILKLEESTKQNKSLDNINSILLNKLKNTDLSIIDKEKIIKTIHYIKNNSNSEIHNRKLENNLVLVGNKIINEENEEHKNNMIDNLYQELKDCVQSDGNMYCNQGISNRIINSLNGVDNSVSITPKWALKEELMRKCGIIRNELEKTKSQDDEDFTDILKEKIKTDLKKEYVDDNKILKEDDLNKEMEEWIEFV